MSLAPGSPSQLGPPRCPITHPEGGFTGGSTTSLAPGSPSQLGPPRCPITHPQKAASLVASTMSPCAWLAVPAGTASVSDHTSLDGGFTGGFDHVPLRLARRPSWDRLGVRSRIFRRRLHGWLRPCPLAP